MSELAVEIAKLLNKGVFRIEVHHYYHKKELCEESSKNTVSENIKKGAYNEVDDEYRNFIIKELMKKNSEYEARSEEKEYINYLKNSLLTNLLDNREEYKHISLSRRPNNVLRELKEEDVSTETGNFDMREYINERLKQKRILKKYYDAAEKGYLDITNNEEDDQKKHDDDMVKKWDTEHSKTLTDTSNNEDNLAPPELDSFDMQGYIEKKRKQGEETEKLELKKRKTPEPVKITPMLRYKKSDQVKIQKNIFLESKQFIMECFPEKTAEELEEKIMDEANKRLDAWNAKHYKK